MAQTDWHAFRRRWRRDGAKALGAVLPPLAAPLRCVALASPFCEFADAVAVARCSRAARRAARQIVAAVRRDFPWWERLWKFPFGLLW